MIKFLLLLIIFISACSEQNDPKLLFDEGQYEKAYKLWKPMAENGNLYAQNYMGIQHYLGLGVDRNYKVAKEWFERAAADGFADAQYNLGAMYENGQFVKKDYTDAYKWFYAADKNGNANAEKRMQSMAEEHKLFPNQMRRAIDLSKEFIN